MADQAPWTRNANLADPDRVATASELVRHFGIWQERAAKAPVYIVHRGRPRFVLTSIDVMQALCEPHAVGRAEARSVRVEALLDSVSDIIVLLDQDLRIVTTSLAARRHLGVVAPAGTTLDAIIPDATGAFLITAAQRVLDSGIAEHVELASALHPGRRLSVLITPFPGGVALIAEDITVADDLSGARARVTALEQAFGSIDGVATGRINLRGYLAAPAPALAAMIGIAAETLSSVRFVTLLDVASRVAVAEAIEAVIADGEARSLGARLLVNRAEPRAVQIGLSAYRQGLAIDGVTMVLIG